MRQLTIRNVSPEISSALDELTQRTGKSLNTLVLELLGDALGKRGRRARLERYVTWTTAQAQAFDKALAGQRQVDESLWR